MDETPVELIPAIPEQQRLFLEYNSVCAWVSTSFGPPSLLSKATSLATGLFKKKSKESKPTHRQVPSFVKYVQHLVDQRHAVVWARQTPAELPVNMNLGCLSKHVSLSTIYPHHASSYSAASRSWLRSHTYQAVALQDSWPCCSPCPLSGCCSSQPSNQILLLHYAFATVASQKSFATQS